MAQLLGTIRPDLFVLHGTVGNIVYGFAGDDVFYDSASADWMRGGAGNDQFYSTSGSDLMFGGMGDDQFNIEQTDVNLMIRGGKGWDELYIRPDMLAEGEAEALRYANAGVLLQLQDGGVLDVSGIEYVELLV